MTLGTHKVILTPVDGTPDVDVSCLVDAVSIQHGRTDPTQQPEASAATLELSTDTTDYPVPSTLEVGALLTITTTVAGVESVRFVGTITDLSIGWDDAGLDTPNAALVQVIATTTLADLGREYVGDEPWPQELDGARVARVLALVGIVLNPATSDPGVVQINPRDVDRQPVLAVAQEVANSASGMLWETREGEVRYADAEHRRNTPPALSVDSCDVLVTPVWQRNTGGLVNRVSIGYGVDEEGGEQPRFYAEDIDSQTRYGIYELSTATELAALADAAAMGQLLLGRNARPAWMLSELPLDLVGFDAARTQTLLALDVNDLLRITGMPVAGSLPSVTSLWIEGWTEELAADRHDLTLRVSDFCRTSPPPRWDDVSSALTWDAVAASITWNGASCLGPLPSEGRWNDVAASLRWDAVAPGITWNTWPY